MTEELSRFKVENETLRNENQRLREHELLLSKDGKKWRSAFDIIKEMNAENEKLRAALKETTDYLHDAYLDIGREEYKAAELAARAALESQTKKEG